MKKLLLALVLSSALLLSACTDQATNGDREVTVVTTLFPQYSVVEALAGDYVNNVFILPFGTDAHDFEPTPSNVTTMLRADLLIYTGDFLEGWVARAIRSQNQATLRVLDLSQFVDLLDDTHDHSGHDHDADHHDHDDHDADHHDHDDHDADHHDHDDHDADHHDHDDHDDHDGHDHGEFDPHYWLDPHNLEEMAKAIAEELILLVPQHEASIRTNLNNYLDVIEQYEDDVKATIARAQTRTLIHGGHNAFGYFAAHFGLEYVTPYSGFSTEIEPSPQARAELLRTMQSVGATVIFAEEFINPRVANVIAQETGAEIIYLFTGENISQELYNEGVSLIDMLYLNLQRLKKGLNVVD
jgi:zinc transport system substrate-binding protein